MVDCSRSSVASVDTVFYLLRICALLGFNCFQLYTEDTYKVCNKNFIIIIIIIIIIIFFFLN